MSDYGIGEILSRVDMKKYVLSVKVLETYCSYRYLHDPTSASLQEARYNPNGIPCFYIADSLATANREVRFNFDNRELYGVDLCEIEVFDALKFSNEFSLTQYLTASAEEGGYRYCQQLANALTSNYSVSGIFYPSRQALLYGEKGDCIALLPNAAQLETGKRLKVFKKRTPQ